MQLNGLGHMFMALDDACDIGLMAQSGFLRFRPYCLIYVGLAFDSRLWFLVYQMVEVFDDVVEWFRP